MDIMGTAMHFAIDDIRHMVGMHSDTEEHMEEDGEYTSMQRYLGKHKGLKRSDSDKSNLSKITEPRDPNKGEKLL